MAEALRDLLDATPPGRLAVAVSHGAAIRVGLAEARWAGERRSGSPCGALGNCGWAVLAEDEPGRSAAAGRRTTALAPTSSRRFRPATLGWLRFRELPSG